MDRAMVERRRRVAAIEATSKQGGGGPRSWEGEPAAIYCRISKATDDDQTGVDRQERMCREIARRLRLEVAPDRVHVDNNRSAWQRSRKRPGWDALLAGMRAGNFRHVIVYHPDRLMRQPRDLEELLAISEEQDITLHGQANRRELSDPDDRFFLRIEVAHACRSSDDTSRRLKDALADRARDGKPHTSKRRFGYAPNGMEIVPDEAEVVREMFRRYVDGETIHGIAVWLIDRGVPTATGRGGWTAASVRRMLRSPHLTGLQVFRGEVVGEGAWPAIIDRGTWHEVQDRLSYRASAHRSRSRAHRYYLLRGLVMCKRCGRHMSGMKIGRGHQPTYCCNSRGRYSKLSCGRAIGAAELEDFVTESALRWLETLDLSGTPSATTALTDAEHAAIEADERELTELKDMWHSRELTTREYRQMRKVIEDRINALRRKTIVRPTADILDDVVGEHAREAWAELTDKKEYERMNAILRFLFAAVIIDKHQGVPGRFDYSRIDIEQNPL